MGTMPDPKDFSDLNYEAFRRLATDPTLSRYERIGFPDSYRHGFEEAIFEDIRRKLPVLDGSSAKVLDIGPGVSELPHLLIQHCENHGHNLRLVDSPEMLAQLPEKPFITKIPGSFPQCEGSLGDCRGAMDAVVSYSVLHYAYVDTNLFGFMDSALSLLAPGGRLLLGDIPNISMRKRFFKSERGIQFHKDFMNTDQAPTVEFNRVEIGKIDDAVVLGMLARARAAGFDAYLLPQAPGLPMANRREDMLFIRP
jgi:SAM-dependent methyltransferase